MKKQLLFIAFASLVTSIASATDLYVRNLGAGGAYSTVSAAIAAASDGDRIIIKPKTTGTGAYVENLTINKSLTFVSETIYNRKSCYF
jgi:pectin methylesterase-like acyl-CoA thioesterase